MKICPMYHTISIRGQSSHPEITRQQVSMENFVGLPIYSSYTGHQGAGMSVVIRLSLGTNTVVSTLYQYFDKFYQINSNLKVSIILI